MIPNRKIARGLWLIAAGLTCMPLGLAALPAQSPGLKEQIAAISAIEAENQKALSEYIWQEQETISLKDKVQSQQLFEVQPGPDGKLRRTPMDLPEANWSQAKKGGGMQQWVTEKKKRSVMMSGQEVKQLAETYLHFDAEALRHADERKDVASEPAATGNGARKLTIHNYLKAGDLVMVVFNQKENEVQTLEVSSYLANPKKPVHILAEFVTDRDGLNHVDVITATAPKSNLSVMMRNLSYERTVSPADR